MLSRAARPRPEADYVEDSGYMNWMDTLVDALVDEVRRQPCCGYHRGARPATEPTAIAAMALASHGEQQAAGRAADWLAACQSDDGSLGIRSDLPAPGWPTGLAVLAWSDVDAEHFADPIQRAVRWILELQGKRIERTESIGHNTQLVGWPWVDGTHSWIEPTAFHVRALKTAGHRDHPRCREAVRLLLDRQLPSGGCNYGNTEVLGQTLLPHIQPSGLALLALEGERDEGGRIARCIAYLAKAITARTATTSLCWAALGLAAHGQCPADARLWLESAYQRTLRRDASPHKFALLALAAAEVNSIHRSANQSMESIQPPAPSSGLTN